MTIEWRYTTHQDLGVLSLAGFLGADAVARFTGAVGWALARGTGPVILDLTELRGWSAGASWPSLKPPANSPTRGGAWSWRRSPRTARSSPTAAIRRSPSTATWPPLWWRTRRSPVKRGNVARTTGRACGTRRHKP